MKIIKICLFLLPITNTMLSEITTDIAKDTEAATKTDMVMVKRPVEQVKPVEQEEQVECCGYNPWSTLYSGKRDHIVNGKCEITTQDRKGNTKKYYYSPDASYCSQKKPSSTRLCCNYSPWTGKRDSLDKNGHCDVLNGEHNYLPYPEACNAQIPKNIEPMPA